MGSIYKCETTKGEAAILEVMREKIAESGIGITLTGNRLTLRWMQDDELVDVHMLISEVTTVEEAKTQYQMSEISERVWDQHPDESAEMFYLEHGERPK